jgi:hypothetical protein
VGIGISGGYSASQAFTENRGRFDGTLAGAVTLIKDGIPGVWSGVLCDPEFRVDAVTNVARDA